MAGFSHVFRQDYDKRVKVGNEYVFCYSKKKLKELYPENDYNLSGEARKGTAKSQESFDARQAKKLARLKEKGLKESDVETLKIGDLKIGNSVLSVYPEGTNNKILGKTDGFVCVSEGNFIALHASRVPFLAIIFSMSAAIIGATLLTVSLLMNPAPPEIVEPDNPLPVVDPLARPMEDDDSEKISSEKGGGSITIAFRGPIYVYLDQNIATLTYGNPNASNQDVVVEIYLKDEGNEYFLGRSGRVPSGSALSQISIADREAGIATGYYKAKLYFHAYEPNTGDKAIVVSSVNDVDLIVVQ
ncbi:MAG: hypothetical protein IKB02_01530 [Clostridia bacterium]|nr:hypothetical protein [Clostridia bacterium]